MRRLSIIALFILCLLLLISCTGEKDSTVSFGEAGIFAAQADTTEAGSVRVPSPAGTKAALCVGWQAQSENGTTIFLPVGATYHYEAGENRNFTPVYFRFTTQSNATALLTDAENGICFNTTVSKADWNALASVAPHIARGTLVLPTTQAKTVSRLTHEAIAPFGEDLQVADIPSDAWSTESDSAFTFSAPFVILRANDAISDYSALIANYTAVGYVKISYTDGSEAYVYASYEKDTSPNVSLFSFPNAVRKFFDLSTNTNGILDLNAKNGALEFATTIPKDHWNRLVSANVTVTRGTLIYPTKGLAEIGGALTHAALAAAQKTGTDIPSTTWLGGSDANTLTFSATLTNIEAYQRATTYTAVGYVKITHADGSEVYVYAAFENGIAPQISVRALSAMALQDVSATESDYYKYSVAGGFSPYSDTEREKLTAWSKLPVMLISDSAVRGNRRLDENYFALYNERFIIDDEDKYPEFAAEWSVIYHLLGDTIYNDGGALIITAVDGEPLTAENVDSIKLDLGTRVIDVTTYLFLDGALVIPYKVYSRPY